LNNLDRDTTNIHTIVDQQIAIWRDGYNGSIYCTSGCANCCTLEVQTTLAEGLLISRTHQPDLTRLEALCRALGEQARDAEDFKSFLKNSRTTIGHCFFLENNNCSIYPHRPLPCRALLSTRPADWCGVDFATLHPLEREAFRSSLDRNVVAWPTHYVAATQELARSQEDLLREQMQQAWGVAATGSLALMVWLGSRLGEETPDRARIEKLLHQLGCDHPYLVNFAETKI